MSFTDRGVHTSTNGAGQRGSCPAAVKAEWRVIPGTEGLYFVSDDGRVSSKPRFGTKGGVLKGGLNTDGYPQVALWVGGEGRNIPIHRLVLGLFVGPPGDGQEARHLDGSRTNNRLDNLAWGTSSENSMDSVRHGTHPLLVGDECHRGHPLDEVNTMIEANGRRCRECKRIYSREYKRAARRRYLAQEALGS